jgi:hypothetical protein
LILLSDEDLLDVAARVLHASSTQVVDRTKGDAINDWDLALEPAEADRLTHEIARGAMSVARLTELLSATMRPLTRPRRSIRTRPGLELTNEVRRAGGHPEVACVPPVEQALAGRVVRAPDGVADEGDRPLRVAHEVRHLGGTLPEPYQVELDPRVRTGCHRPHLDGAHVVAERLGLREHPLGRPARRPTGSRHGSARSRGPAAG